MENYNYITIQGWMINELKLRDTELIIYAIVYGFAQSTEDKCVCSIDYFMKSTGKSRRAVINNINSLVKKGLIFKEKVLTSRGNQNEYSINFNYLENDKDSADIAPPQCKSCTTPSADIAPPQCKSCTTPSADVAPNNIYYNNIYNNNINNTKYIYRDIVDYLNERTGAHYKSSSRKTKDLIKARLNEGYTLEDFKTVIDKKTNEWLNDEKMCRYLRPETLFSNKFEGYLNQKEKREELKTNNPFLKILAEDYYGQS